MGIFSFRIKSFQCNFFVIRNIDGIHGAMQELMNRQKYSMLKNNHEIAQQYMELQVINQYFKAMRNEMEYVLFNAQYVDNLPFKVC